MKRLFKSLASTNDGAFVIDGDHRIIFWNHAAEKILEYTAEEAVGRPCYAILAGRDEQGITFCQRYCKLAVQADSGDVLPNTDVFSQTRNGQGCWLNISTFMYPVGDKPSGRVIVHLFRDASEKKEQQRFVDRVLAASEQLHKDDTLRVMTVAPAQPQTNILTAREREILALLAQGHGTDKVAGTLILSPATVRNHVQNILSKLGVHSRLEAVAQAYQKGLIETKSS